MKSANRFCGSNGVLYFWKFEEKVSLCGWSTASEAKVKSYIPL
jgi:hypothetical protein